MAFDMMDGISMMKDPGTGKFKYWKCCKYELLNKNKKHVRDN